VGLAAVAGFVAQKFVGSDYSTGVSIGIAVYLLSYYVARFAWYRALGKEAQSKIYTTGIGSFVLMFLFTWMLLFTLQGAGFPV
jgi:hypothetical protein